MAPTRLTLRHDQPPFLNARQNNDDGADLQLGDGTEDPTTSGTSHVAILVCNSISLVACVLVLALYGYLARRPEYRRLMKRPSLAIAACMSLSDLILHCANLAGYGDLPSGLACAFVGGWLFAFPSLLSVFYSCVIAFNSQLHFVWSWKHHISIGEGRLLLFYILVPLALAFSLTTASIASHFYGFDQTWGYCWYSTENVSSRTVLNRMLGTYIIPSFLCLLYLVFAVVTIVWSVFGKNSTLYGIPNDSSVRDSKSYKPFSRAKERENQATQQLSAKALFMRALVYRLLGYIFITVVCIIPGSILDLQAKLAPDTSVPEGVNGLFDGLNGLLGLFNAIIVCSDPALLVVWRAGKEYYHSHTRKSSSNSNSALEWKARTVRTGDGTNNIQDQADSGDETDTNYARTKIELATMGGEGGSLSFIGHGTQSISVESRSQPSTTLAPLSPIPSLSPRSARFDHPYSKHGCGVGVITAVDEGFDLDKDWEGEPSENEQKKALDQQVQPERTSSSSQDRGSTSTHDRKAPTNPPVVSHRHQYSSPISILSLPSQPTRAHVRHASTERHPPSSFVPVEPQDDGIEADADTDTGAYAPSRTRGPRRPRPPSSRPQRVAYESEEDRTSDLHVQIPPPRRRDLERVERYLTGL